MRLPAPAALLAAALVPPPLVIAILLAQPVYTLNGEGRYEDPSFLALGAGSVVDQQITARHDGLSVVAIPIATSVGLSTARVRLTLVNAADQVMVDRTLDARRLTDIAYSDIAFGPIAHSAGMTFHVRLEAPTTISGPPLSLLTVPATGGMPPLTLNGQPSTVVLPVHTHYGSSVPAVEAFPILLSRASQDKLGFLRLPWLAIWLLVTLAATGAAVWALARLFARSD